MWDVEFERLAGRPVVATGERCLDLAVRLRHAGVAHTTVRDELEALAAPGARAVEFVGNYTAFQVVRRRLARGVTPSPGISPTPGAATPSVSSAPSVPRLRRSRAAGESALRVVVVHPDLLGTYGDGGNGAVLAGRAAWRGLAVELVLADSDDPLPSGADIYCLGGGEDGPQVQSAERLRDGSLGRAVDAGAVVFAVCAGYQVLGHSFPGADGALHAGVGLLDIHSVKGTRRRAVGELLAAPIRPVGAHAEEPDPVALDTLTGFENHGAVTRLGSGVRPVARVLSGVGNGSGGGDEGARVGRVLGSYLHGPALARNPALADLLLAWATGSIPTALDDVEERALPRRAPGGGVGAWRFAGLGLAEHGPGTRRRPLAPAPLLSGAASLRSSVVGERPARVVAFVFAARVGAEGPGPAPRGGLGATRRGRLSGRGASTRRPPVAARLVGQRGEGGIDASLEPPGVLAGAAGRGACRR